LSSNTRGNKKNRTFSLPITRGDHLWRAVGIAKRAATVVSIIDKVGLQEPVVWTQLDVPVVFSQKVPSTFVSIFFAVFVVPRVELGVGVCLHKLVK
jgi:hypothetical protein